MKLLIATTNKGKFKEISEAFETLPYVECVSLDELDKKVDAPEETEKTVEGNALLKATYYGEKTGIRTLADDTGLFIESLDGWPGVYAGRVADSDDERCQKLLEKIGSSEKRDAHFQGCLVLYSPSEHTSFVVSSDVHGEILKQMPKQRLHGHGYDPIFFVSEYGKTLDQMTTTEKNGISHRGKNLSKMKYHIQNTYAGKHIVVPLGLVIKDGKILMNKRNDPHNSEFHGVWEFPGGAVELGESMEANVVREISEECGYDVKVITQLQGVQTKHRKAENFEYQVYLVPYVCKIVGGDGVFSDSEVLESRWVAIDDVTSLKLFPDDAGYFEHLKKELKEVIESWSM